MLKRLFACDWFYYSISIVLGLGIVLFNHVQTSMRYRGFDFGGSTVQTGDVMLTPGVRRIEIHAVPVADGPASPGPGSPASR